MTDIKEVALPELPIYPETMWESLRKGFTSGQLKSPDSPLELIEAYAKEYGVMCYEAGKRAVIKQSLAQPVQAAALDGWKTIETAPKDERVLVFTGKEIYAATWGKNFFTGDEKWIVGQFGTEGDQVLVDPTHWMPFHKPPAINAAPKNGEQS